MSCLMGKACTSFAADEFRGNYELRTVALYTRLCSMDSDYDGAKSVAKELLTAINVWYGNSRNKPESVRLAEFGAYESLGNIALHQGDPQRAIENYLCSKNLLLENGLRQQDSFKMMRVDVGIAEAKGMLCGGWSESKSSTEEILVLRKKIYEDAKKKDKSLTVICNTGLNLADVLMDLDRFEEAKELLLLDLYPRSKQVNGPTHPITLKIEEHLRRCWTEIVQKLKK